MYWLKQAISNLKSQRGFCFSVCMTLGVALTAVLAVISLVWAVLYKPLPYPDEDRLMRLSHQYLDGQQQVLGEFINYPAAVWLHQHENLFADSVLMTYQQSKIHSLPNEPNWQSRFVTTSWFEVLQPQFAVGTGFDTDLGLDQQLPQAVISYQSWVQNFAQRSDILEQSLQIGNRSYRVVGVLSENFVEPKVRNVPQAQVILPWDFNPIKAERQHNWINPHPDIEVLVKLPVGSSSAQVAEKLQNQLAPIWRERTRSEAFFADYSIRIKLPELKQVITGDISSPLYLLLAAVIGALLIAVANLSNLFLLRTAKQVRQFAIMAAIGANRSQLIKSQFIETLCLMLVSAICALIGCQITLSMVSIFFADALPRAQELQLSWISGLSAVLVSFVLAAFFAWISAKAVRYQQLKSHLVSSGKGGAIQVAAKVRKGLVAAQVALVSLLLFFNVSLFFQSVKVIEQPLGIDTNNVYALSVDLKSSMNAAEVASAMQTAKQQMQSQGAVQAVSVSYSPLGEWDSAPFQLQGEEDKLFAYYLPVDQDYFGLLNQPLVTGRNISKQDVLNHHPVLLINEFYAKQFGGAENALGQRLQMGGSQDYYQIIGVVKDTIMPGETEVLMRAYLPPSAERYQLKLLVKSNSDKSLSKAWFEQQLQNADARLSVDELHVLSVMANDKLQPLYITAASSISLMLVSYAMAAVGLFGVLGYGVNLRRIELATRMAIGAKGKQILSLVFIENSKAIATGILASLFALGVYWLTSSGQLAINLGVSDLLVNLPITLGLVLAVGLLACYLPLQAVIKQPLAKSLRQGE